MYKKCVLPVLLFLLSLCFHVEANHRNTLAPNLRLVTYAPLNCNWGAYSLLGEVGCRNYRVNGTYGFEFCDSWRFKASAEYLTQKLDYHFSFGGNAKRWVNQYAIGGVLQYQTCFQWLETIDFGFAYSHACGKRIDTFRRIAGSNGEYYFVGSDFCLSDCSWLFASIDYDHVKYHRHFRSDTTSSGLGLTLEYMRCFCNDFALYLTGEFKQPFRFYEAKLQWRQPCQCNVLDWAVYANYTEGRRNLPNVATAGLEVSFAFGGPWGYDCCDNSCDTYYNYVPSYYGSGDLVNWVAESAVYIPVVLAIADGGTPPPPCVLPISRAIPNQNITPGTNVNFNTAQFFTSPTPLQFALVGTLPPGLTFNPATGVISGLYTSPFGGTFPVTVTGTNACGSTSQSFVITAPSVS